MVTPARRIRVLIVDDSPTIRRVLKKGIEQDPALEVIGTAPDPYVARDLIVRLRPDVVTLDVEMPRMDGLTFLRKLIPQLPIPVVMVSSLTQRGAQLTFDALSAGAVDFVGKPRAGGAKELQVFFEEIRRKVHIASSARVRPRPTRPGAGGRPSALARPPASGAGRIIAIGSSTGGTEALRDVLAPIPVGCPGIVMVQHMPVGFTAPFAARLDELSHIEVKEARSGDLVVPGRALLAPAGLQMRVQPSGNGGFRVTCQPGAPVSGHCPSVDDLFLSVARHAGPRAIGAILTGMGADGARGMKSMRDAGARTVGQDEATCVVYGMPRAAFEAGGVEMQRPLSRVAETLMHLASQTVRQAPQARRAG